MVWTQEQAKEYARQYYQGHKEQFKTHRREHKDEVNARNRKYYREHRDEIVARKRQWHLEQRKEQKVRLEQFYRLTKWEVLAHYSLNGIPQCVSCGISDIDVLCLDHINNNGASFGRPRATGIILYSIIKRQGFPESFQTLCANCNLKKEIERKRKANALPVDSNGNSQRYRPTRQLSGLFS